MRMKNINPGVVFPVLASALLGVGLIVITAARSAMGRMQLLAFLDQKLFPALIKYATHRAHISFMLVLWLLLIACGSFTAFELVGGNYTNGLSGLMTCIILLQQDKHHKTVRRMHAHHKREIQALHAKVDAMNATLSVASARIRKTGTAK